MTNLQLLEQELKGIYDLKRAIKKGEKIFKGETRTESALEFENTLSVKGLDYERNDFKTMTIFTFPTEECLDEETIEEPKEEEYHETHQENQW